MLVEIVVKRFAEFVDCVYVSAGPEFALSPMLG